MSARRTIGGWPPSAIAAVVALAVLFAAVASAAGNHGDDDASTTTTTVATAATTTVQASPTTTTPTTTVTAPTPTTTAAAPATTRTTAPAQIPIALADLPAAALVDRLVVATPDPNAPTYVRSLFDGGGWSYDPATGCSTRERVLIDESLVKPHVDDRCRSTGGRWRSVYDGVVTTDPADLQIDHFVPLADAWRSGAWRWTSQQRLAYANDLTSPDTLVAVSASSNESKGDATPDEWLPPARSEWCGYASTWVRVKARWLLEVTPAEKATLVSILSGC